MLCHKNVFKAKITRLYRELYLDFGHIANPYMSGESGKGPIRVLHLLH